MNLQPGEQIYHIWFSTKGRQEILQGEIAGKVKQLLREIALDNGISLIEVETAIDHVHLLILVNQSQSLANVMQQLKGASARRAFLEHPDLRLEVGQDSLWQKGYGRRRITPQEVPRVTRYIRTQNERPHRHDR